jgi:hypothetical protein
MKKLIALVCLLMATKALLAAPVWTAMDLVSLAIHGVRFSFSDLVPKEMTVDATGYGKTQEEAVNNALVIAVQKGIGVLVVSDTTVDGDKVIRDLAATYSSGIVNSYEILKCENNSCAIRAKVSPARFQRKLMADTNVVKVNGKDLHAQYITTQNVLKQRMKLTEYYFSQLHQSGLDVKVKTVALAPAATPLTPVGGNPNATIVVDYEVRMNPEFKKDFISFLQRLEKDTNGKTENHQQVYIQWGPTGLFENRVFINAYDPNFRIMMERYLATPISIGIKEIGMCERFDPPGGNVMTVDWYGFRKTKYVTVPVNKLQNVNTLSVSIGC